MKNRKVIKLTESDLKIIVEKVLKEKETDDSWWDWAQNILNPSNVMVSVLADGLPLYIRNVLKFITLQKLTERNKDFSNEEISGIANTLCAKSKKYRNCDPSKWPGNNKNLVTPDDYGLSNKNGGSYTEKLSNMEGIGKSLSLGLGSSRVVNSGDEWLLTDNYDFINATEFPDRKEVYSSVFNAIPDMYNSVVKIAKNEDKIKYMERLLSWIHKSGYKGYKIELRIPKNKCQFCSKGNS